MTLHPVPAEWAARAYVDAAGYAEKYRRSIEEPEAFWRDESARLDWIRPWTRLNRVSYDEADFGIEWFADGQLNVSANCLDRHLAERGDTVAIIWEGDDPAQQRRITYRELHQDVCRFANALKTLGVRKGERVTIYLPMIPEAAVAMLACARIGAIHSIVFGGFSPDALAGRIQDCDSRVVITADAGMRGGKQVPLKANVDAALAQCPGVEAVLVIRHVGNDAGFVSGRDHWWHELRGQVSAECPAAVMNA
ncbi:MAG TPA: AMP-binding protein, partial [Novosphingobium sp.]